ncbi:MAG: hypothetical protein QOK05_2270 [Chloroflexota bacterium]|jgi:hypothetical protein|nr:hypothetical protein [Chloroflexota bacterium]
MGFFSRGPTDETPTTGSLTDTPLRAVLTKLHRDRATGILTVSSGAQAAQIFWLFGHLFHATSGDLVGVDAVREADRYSGGDFAFDSKAKLPAEESIKDSVDIILAGLPDTWIGPVT